VLEAFIAKISLNQGYIQVEEVAVVAKFEATEEFDHFQIIHGDLIGELKGSFDLGLERLKASTDEIKRAIDDSRDVLQAEIRDTKTELKYATEDSRDVLQSELKSVDSHLSENFETMTHETESFREQTHTDLEQTHADFTELDVKYDRVSTSLESIDKHVQDVTHALENLGQTLLKTVAKEG